MQSLELHFQFLVQAAVIFSIKNEGRLHISYVHKEYTFKTLFYILSHILVLIKGTILQLHGFSQLLIMSSYVTSVTQRARVRVKMGRRSLNFTEFLQIYTSKNVIRIWPLV